MQFYFSWAKWFYLLAILIAGFSLYGEMNKRRLLSKIGSGSIFAQMCLVSKERRLFKCICLVFACLFFVLALSRPQWGAEKKNVSREGLDLIFVLDTSLSMRSQDIKPSRFEKSKFEIKSFIGKLKGDRVGLIPFAGSSFLQSPLTLDYAAFYLFLDSVDVGSVYYQGSSLAQALQSAMRAFGDNKDSHQAIVLLTDGEFHGENLDKVLQDIKNQSIPVYSLGLGTKEGAPIPLQSETGEVTSYKKDKKGAVVISKLDEELLRRVSEVTGGLYYPVTPSEKEIDLIYRDMGRLGKKEFTENMVTQKEDHYQIFLIIGIFFFLVSQLLTDGRLEKPREQIE